MKFEEVLCALSNGMSIRRKQWNKDYCLKKYDGSFSNYSNFNYINYCTVNDILKDDWEIV